MQSCLDAALGPFTLRNSPNVILETVKRGDDDDFITSRKPQSVICRLYESKGGHAKATFTTTLPVSKATVVDLLERHAEDLKLDVQGSKSSIVLPFRGFQVITIKLEL